MDVSSLSSLCIYLDFGHILLKFVDITEEGSLQIEENDFFLIEVWLIYNVVFIFAIQQSDSVIRE